jgi:hypothetical protein
MKTNRATPEKPKASPGGRQQAQVAGDSFGTKGA